MFAVTVCRPRSTTSRATKSSPRSTAIYWRTTVSEGHRINVRKPHENGDVESSHGHFKDALDQALRLRGNRDFDSEDDYMAFVRQLVSRRNVDREKRFAEELAVLSPLPPQRRSTCTSVFVTVKSDSVIRVKRNAYSVSSKYIGLRLEVRIHQDHLELWYRGECRRADAQAVRLRQGSDRLSPRDRLAGPQAWCVCQLQVRESHVPHDEIPHGL